MSYINQTKPTVCHFNSPSQSEVQLLCREIFTDTVSVQRTILEFLTQKRSKGSHELSNSKTTTFLNSSTRAGTDDICALRFTEGAKAPIDVFGPNSKMVSGARLELGQCAGHG